MGNPKQNPQIIHGKLSLVNKLNALTPFSFPDFSCEKRLKNGKEKSL